MVRLLGTSPSFYHADASGRDTGPYLAGWHVVRHDGTGPDDRAISDA
jgi:hypothetical protein